VTVGAWGGWWNAEVYDRVVRETSVYTELNGRLAELADLANARRVLDVGCGTGATAQACLERLPRDSSIVGVDSAESMVELARQQVLDPRAGFVVCAAEDVDRAVTGPFDRVVANAAVGRFDDLRRAIAAIARVVSPGNGLFVFNLPADRLAEEPGLTNPVQATLARLCESLSGVPYCSPLTRLGTRELDAFLTSAGFAPTEPKRFELPVRRGAMVRLFEVPAILEPMTPQLDASEREELLEQIRWSGDQDEVFVVPWMFFVTRKVNA